MSIRGTRLFGKITLRPDMAVLGLNLGLGLRLKGGILSLARKWKYFNMFYTTKCLRGFSAPQTKNRFEFGHVFEEQDRFEKTNYGGTLRYIRSRDRVKG